MSLLDITPGMIAAGILSCFLAPIAVAPAWIGAVWWGGMAEVARRGTRDV